MSTAHHTRSYLFAGNGRETVRPGCLRVKTYLKPEKKNKPNMRKKLAEHRACT
jgi:hypothetical protein